MCLIRKQDKTKEDVKLLLQQHRKLVYFTLAKYKQLGNQDAESAAWEALWDAINLFDVYANNEFSTYACTVIGNKIKDVLRKDKKHQSISSELTEINSASDICVEQCVCTSETTSAVLKVFKAYVNKKHGVSRDVLLVWESTMFEGSLLSIANACNTTPSYVGRVQCAFRAHLTGQLRGQ